MPSTVCSDSALRCLSKSYIALPIAVVAIEVAGDVLSHGCSKRHEAGVVARVSQSFHSRFGKILILPADSLRHVHIFDFHGQTKRIEHGSDHVAETFGLASSDIENAVYPCCVEKPAHNGNGIVDVDKIAALLAVGNALAVRLEQTHSLTGFGDIENLAQDPRHMA